MIREDLLNAAVECGIPVHMREGLIEYLMIRRRPGGFLHAVLSNDLMLALRRADNININCLRNYGVFLDSYAPMASYGSYEKVDEWLEGK